MKAQPTASLSSIPSGQEAFQQEGYLILREFLEPEVVAGARAAMERLVETWAQTLLADGKISDVFPDEPLETRLLRLKEAYPEETPVLFRAELHQPELYALFFHPRLLDIVETLLGSEIRLYPNYSARPKLPDFAPGQVLWHQDGGYTQQGGQGDSRAVAELRMVNVWTPLIPVYETNGCMQFVPGTHRLGAVPHVTKEFYLEIAPEYLAPYVGQAVSIELNPGDLALFHNLLFHQGLPNRSGQIRWSLDWRYQDATQPTLRQYNGHIARSRRQPETAVASADAWANLTFQ